MFTKSTIETDEKTLNSAADESEYIFVVQTQCIQFQISCEGIQQIFIQTTFFRMIDEKITLDPEFASNEDAHSESNNLNSFRGDVHLIHSDSGQRNRVELKQRIKKQRGIIPFIRQLEHHLLHQAELLPVHSSHCEGVASSCKQVHY